MGVCTGQSDLRPDESNHSKKVDFYEVDDSLLGGYNFHRPQKYALENLENQTEFCGDVPFNTYLPRTGVVPGTFSLSLIVGQCLQFADEFDRYTSPGESSLMSAEYLGNDEYVYNTQGSCQGPATPIDLDTCYGPMSASDPFLFNLDFGEKAQLPTSSPTASSAPTSSPTRVPTHSPICTDDEVKRVAHFKGSFPMPNNVTFTVTALLAFAGSSGEEPFIELLLFYFDDALSTSLFPCAHDMIASPTFRHLVVLLADLLECSKNSEEVFLLS